MKKYQTGLVIGRFQPFHLGHKFLIEKALALCDKLYVGIGSAQLFDEKNPYNMQKRKKFLKTFLSKEKIQDRILSIIAIDDFPDDDVWYERLAPKIPGTEVIIGDNEWVNGIFERHGIPVERIGYYKRHILEGTKIRKSMKMSEPWKNRVPEYLIPDIEKKK